MSPDGRDRQALKFLASMPFMDRLDLFAVSGQSRGSTYDAVAGLERRGLADSVPHASDLIVPTRRYSVTAAGLRCLAEEDDDMDELLRVHPVSSQWRRILLRRLDAVAVIYRVASGIAHVDGPIRFRWYRGLPLDATVTLSGGRAVGLVRQGITSDKTGFAKRLWRLFEGSATLMGSTLPRTLLVLVPDAVRLNHARRILRNAPVRTYLAIEKDATAAGPYDPAWRATYASSMVDLDRIVSRARSGVWIPVEPQPARASPPVSADLRGTDGKRPNHLLPSILKPSDKRVLDTLADWPWIAPRDVEGLLGVARPRFSQLTSRLRRLGLTTLVSVGGERRMALSDRGLSLLAHRDRTSVGIAFKRWSARPIDPESPMTWRNVAGTRSRQLLRNVEHTEAVHRFLAALSRQVRSTRDCELIQIDPPHRASRHFRHEDVLRSVHPDAFGIVRRRRETLSFFLEWERRAVIPSTMAARLAPYLRYYSTRRPVEDNAATPLVLVVFDDPLAEARFIGVARQEMLKAGVDLPLWVSHRRTLEEVGPLGRAWRAPDVLDPTHLFSQG